jgi:hypothetical protein
VRHWFLKNSLPGFHAGSVGGRNATFEIEEEKIAQEYLVQFFAVFPSTNVKQAALELTEAFNRPVSKQVSFFLFGFHQFYMKVVRRLLKDLNWSRKIPTSFQVWKYTVDNLGNLINY